MNLTHTIVALFKNEAEASLAVPQLVNIGILRNYIEISKNLSSTPEVNNGDKNESGITHFFKTLFNESDVAGHYSKADNTDYFRVTVHVPSIEEAANVAGILGRNGAIHVEEKFRDYGFPAGSEGRESAAEDDLTLYGVEEQLKVEKKIEEKEGVRAFSRIAEKPVEEHVFLREEHIHVMRKPVNRPVLDIDKGDHFTDQDIELTEKAEVPVINKEARVVEEIRIRKEVTERDEVIHETLRNTDVDIHEIKDNKHPP